MNDYDELYDFHDDAEDEFDDFDTGFEGVEQDDYYPEEEYEMDYIPMEEEYDSYRPSSIGRIDPNDRTYTVKVVNASGAAAEAIIFGANEGAAQPAGVTVDVVESSHAEVREESKANPFKIRGMKMSVSDALQFDNVLSIVRRTSSGTTTTRVYQPRNATSPQNFTQSLIDDGNFEMDVTGQDSIRLTVNDGVTIVFTFTIKARANMGNLLMGENVAELATAKRTTGLPQVDMKISREAPVFGLKPKKKRLR